MIKNVADCGRRRRWVLLATDVLSVFDDDGAQWRRLFMTGFQKTLLHVFTVMRHYYYRRMIMLSADAIMESESLLMGASCY